MQAKYLDFLSHGQLGSILHLISAAFHIVHGSPIDLNPGHQQLDLFIATSMIPSSRNHHYELLEESGPVGPGLVL